MIETVHILASCRNITLLPATLLVFKTLRVGFPSARVVVWVNDMHQDAKIAVAVATRNVGGELMDLGIGRMVRHDAWIEELYKVGNAAFWICDTDVVFLSSCEDPRWFGNNVTFAGRLVPEFDEEWTKAIHRERLHTALMWLNPNRIREKIWEWVGRLPESWMQPKLEFFRQTYWPTRGGRTYFNDTTAGLWHTVGGTPFSEAQNAAFEHLNCGTYSDLIGPKLSIPNFRESQLAVCHNPELARGIQKQQDKYLASRSLRTPLRKKALV